jgi:hypothetical protein
MKIEEVKGKIISNKLKPLKLKMKLISATLDV